MKTCIIVLGVLVWLTCGFFAYGFTLGEATHQHPWFRSQHFAIAWGFAGGPISLVAIGVVDGYAHWRTEPLSKADAWAAHQRRWPNLSYEEFERTY